MRRASSWARCREAILSGERQAPLVPRKVNFPSRLCRARRLASHITGSRDETAEVENPDG